MKYIKIEPEVIVGLGEDTKINKSNYPPIVNYLHINLEDWLGDDLMENFPVFIITEYLKSSLETTRFSGYTIKDLKLTFDEYITYIHPEDKTRVENWIENYLHGKESQDTISYKLLINGKIVDMRLKIYNREVYTNRILLEGYIQNITDITLITLAYLESFP